MKVTLSLLAIILAVIGGTGTSLGQAGGTSATKGTTPEEISGVGGSANVNQRIDESRPGDYLSGKVEVEGNPLLWDPIPVTVYCDGQSRDQVYADGKGRFEFKSTRMEGTTPINTKAVKLTALYVGCTVRASLAGYRSTSLEIANRNMTDDPDIGTVKLLLDEHAKGTEVSATSAAAPKDAVKAFEKARDEAFGRNWDKSENQLKKAVQIDPRFAAAWYQLGKMQQKKNSPEARDSFAKAAAADPQYLPPYVQLAEIDAIHAKWQDVLDETTHALQLDAEGSPRVWYYDALAKFNLKHSKEAESSAQKAFAMDPSHQAPNTEQLLAVLEAGRGDFNDALTHLRHSLTYLPTGSSSDLVKQQIAMLETKVQGAK